MEDAEPKGTNQLQPHAASADEVVTQLASDARRGLTAAEAQRRRDRHGPNRLAEAPPEPWWLKFLGQFKDLVIWILIGAAAISGFMGEWIDSVAIMAIVILNGVLGYLQEAKAERALAALQRMAAPLAKVLRDGVAQTVPAADVVPGDCVELEAGDNIPADARLIEAFNFQTQEAALTGESVPVAKEPHCQLDVGVPLGDRRNMVYMGTVAAVGKASAVVTGTGMGTELGRIAGMLQRYEPEPTPLQRRLVELGKVLLTVCLVIVAVIFAINMLRGGHAADVFLNAVALAVAAVPEGLPAVVTIALALGLQRMVKRNALIRKLPSVETLGCVTVICSDKTGTLTRNEMTVRVVAAGDAWHYVTGAGYTPHGEFYRCRKTGLDEAVAALFDNRQSPESSDAFEKSALDRDDDLRQVLVAGARCNNARLSPRTDQPEGWQVLGDPTEGALVVLARKGRVDAAHREHVLYEIPFDSDRKMMSVVVGAPGAATTMYTKGAVEVVLANCEREQRGGQPVPLSDARRQEILQANARLASQALRVLAMAYRLYPDGEPADHHETGLVFAGLVGMIDPPREEVKVAVQRCRQAGIRPVMITGDHPATAEAIARELHIAEAGERVLTGPALDAMTDDELLHEVRDVSVYARVSAEHKLRVVKAWKAHNQVVAMTGDGVNDAPAVKAADIGIAMGITGTDVTKEASDMVLTDDNFTSIVNAVEEGRGIFDNIQKFVHYLLSCNAGEVLLMFFAAVIGWRPPLEAIQLLWINLVTDGLPALALGMDPPETGIMRRPPRPPRQPVITLERGAWMLISGSLIALAAGLGFAIVGNNHDDEHQVHAKTAAFCIMALSQLFFSFTCRSRTKTVFQVGLFTNPQLIAAVAVSGLLQLGAVTLPFAEPIFKVSAHSVHEWELVVLLALMPATVVEIVKLLYYRKRHST